MTYLPLATPMGELHFSTPAATTCTDQNTWYLAAGTTTLLTGGAFDMPQSNRLRYTGVQSRHLHAGVTISVTASAAAQTIEFAVFKGGSQVTGSEVTLYQGTGSDTNSTAIHCMTTIATNEYIELWVRNTTSASKTVTVADANVFAVAMVMA